MHGQAPDVAFIAFSGVFWRWWWRKIYRRGEFVLGWIWRREEVAVIWGWIHRDFVSFRYLVRSRIIGFWSNWTMGATSGQSTQPFIGNEQPQSNATVEHHGYPVIRSEPPLAVNYYGGSHQVVHVYTDNDWTTGILGCMEDVPNCVFTMVCPCLAFGRVVEHLDDGNTPCITAALVWYVIQQLTSCGCVYSYGYRKKLRRKYNLPSRPLPDWFVHYFCWSCAICQVMFNAPLAKLLCNLVVC